MRRQYDLTELKRLQQQPGERHPLLGDLNDPAGVRMPDAPLAAHTYHQRSPYFVHVSITGRCNARCKGCINSCVTTHGEDAFRQSTAYDTEPERDATAIAKLIENFDGDEIAVCLYGGEPLLAADRMAALVENLAKHRLPQTVRYMLYTNGILLDRTIQSYPELMADIWLYSVSIDGREEQHNAIRRGADLRTVHRNLEALNAVRTGDVLMWSTLREEQSLRDCFEEFLFLHGRGLADQFFWHWVETDEAFGSLGPYADRYGSDLAHIMETYVSWLGEGKLLPIIHVNELVLYLLTGHRRTTSGCGVEASRNYDIAGGTVHVCADLPGDWAIGTIADDGTPTVETRDLTSLVDYKNDLGCADCGVHGYCGGRCPVQAMTSTALRLVQYCQLMRLHVGIVQHYASDIARALERSGLQAQDLYDRSALYAQFTDVTP